MVAPTGQALVEAAFERVEPEVDLPLLERVGLVEGVVAGGGDAVSHAAAGQGLKPAPLFSSTGSLFYNLEKLLL